MLLFRLRFAYFKADMASSEVSEKFSQLLLGFAAGAVALLASNLNQLAGGPWSGPLQWSVGILGFSLFCGAVQLVLAHVAAQVKAGFGVQEDAEKAAREAAEQLSPEKLLSILRQALHELRSTRLPPDRWLIDAGLRDVSLLDGLVLVQRRLQRLVQAQAALFRLQLLSVTGSAAPLVFALIRGL